jgi:hypothetical protein
MREAKSSEINNFFINNYFMALFCKGKSLRHNADDNKRLLFQTIVKSIDIFLKTCVSISFLLAAA